ncbi:hypothetical protein C8Q80DRAFT_1125469 [Daedaleopsis nitida]|nr:hypothetical protein C8Q80DRAFT_1125469 [Daedaleopsis nitida]
MTPERHALYQVPPGTPHFDKLDAYMTLKEDSSHDVYTRPSSALALHLECAQRVSGGCLDCELGNRIREGDAEACLDAALRHMSGCEAPYSPEDALHYVELVLDPQPGVPIVPPSEELYRRALALSAMLHHEVHLCSRHIGTMRAYRKDAALLRAAQDADAAVARGLRCEGVFRVAATILALGELLHQDGRGGARFGCFEALWTAHDEYRRVKERQKQMPHRYQCAAAFCGLHTMKGRSSGSVRDWARHKSVCVKP